MGDLLEKDCVVIASEVKLLALCHKYRIPCKPIHTSFFSRSSAKYPYIISRQGIKECSGGVPSDLTIFETIEALRYYLFKSALFRSGIIVHKKNYFIYLKTIKYLKRLGIKTIKDKTYFDEADYFYISNGAFQELGYFACDRIATMANGIQYKASDFLSDLKSFIRNKNKYKRDITYYQSKVGENL